MISRRSLFAAESGGPCSRSVPARSRYASSIEAISTIGRIFREDRGDAVAPLAVEIVMAVEENRLRAELRGGAQRHRRMNAETARFVTRGSDHAALIALASDDNGQTLAAQGARAAQPKRRTRPYQRGELQRSNRPRRPDGASCFARN